MSGRCPLLAGRFAAVSLAMEAKCGSLDRATLEALQDRVRALENAPLSRAVDRFATDVDQLDGSRLALVSAGQVLLDAIERMSKPDPVGSERADLHG